MHKYFSLARRIDPEYQTNKWVLILVPILFFAGAVYGFVVTSDPYHALRDGLYLAGHFFFAWAIAREIDPDHDYSAFVAAAIAIAVWCFGNYAHLFVNFFLLLLLRLAARSTGRQLLLADWLVLFAAAIWTTIEGKYYILPLLSLAAIADYFLQPRNKGSLIPALIAAVLAAIALYVHSWPAVKVTQLLLWVFGGATALVVFLVTTTHKISSVTDITSELMHLQRVKLALLVSLLVIFVEIFFYGLPGFWDVSPLVAAIAGAALFRPLVWIKKPS